LTPPPAASSYVPDKGDIVWINFTPTSGHEQAGVRPALVLSPKAYNEKAGLMLCCPITSQKKGYPFEVEVNDDASGITGVALADHVKSLDWRQRNVVAKGKVSASILTDVLTKIHTLL
jgi:mRNA interferase MazF